MSYIGKFQSALSPDTLYSVGSTLFGTCDTAANIAEKNILLPDFDALLDGITIYIQFANTNTAIAPKFKFIKDIEGTATELPVKDAYRTENQRIGTLPGSSWKNGAIVGFTYNGYNWVMSSGGSGSSIVKDGILDMR